MTNLDASIQLLENEALGTMRHINHCHLLTQGDIILYSRLVLRMSTRTKFISSRTILM